MPVYKFSITHCETRSVLVDAKDADALFDFIADSGNDEIAEQIELEGFDEEFDIVESWDDPTFDLAPDGFTPTLRLVDGVLEGVD